MMTYDILIQAQPENVYRATVLGWPDLSVEGNSEQTVVEHIQKAIRERLAQGKIVRIEIDEDVTTAATPEHPWLPFLGMWKDDPTFDEFTAQMEAYRQELDKAA
jgi:predicted RNase H-like HicB family nuclease